MAANSNSVVLTQDLRAATMDYKRDSTQKHKWNLGEASGPGRDALHPRPKRPEPKRKIHKGHAAKGVHRKAIAADTTETITDSSADEEVEEPCAAPAPDAEIAYSFDAERGPSQGSQILGLALEKAVEQFENNVTDKLVRDEYEVLGTNGEALMNKKAGKSNAAIAEEEDYEFV